MCFLDWSPCWEVQFTLSHMIKTTVSSVILLGFCWWHGKELITTAQACKKRLETQYSLDLKGHFFFLSLLFVLLWRPEDSIVRLIVLSLLSFMQWEWAFLLLILCHFLNENNKRKSSLSKSEHSKFGQSSCLYLASAGALHRLEFLR